MGVEDPDPSGKFTDWGSIIDTNLNPDEEVFYYSGDELVEIFRDTVGGTDGRYLGTWGLAHVSVPPHTAIPK